MKTVAVLMSTYNGEKYLAEQLDSILYQEDVNIKILIRDDGSTDSTKDIIREYQKSYDFISLIEGENVGWRKSFFNLISEVATETKYDYYAFCDQDDIWLPNKLKEAIKAISNIGKPQVPILYCSNLYFYKDGINHGKIMKQHPLRTLKNCLLRNYATGCTIVFNYKLLYLLSTRIPNLTIAHDYWAYIIATLCGEVIIDDNSYILYRQHENNQIGVKKGYVKLWKRRLKNLILPNFGFSRETMAKEIISNFSEYMTTDSLIAVSQMANYNKSLLHRLKFLFDNGYTFNSLSNDFWFKMRIILGKI